MRTMEARSKTGLPQIHEFLTRQAGANADNTSVTKCILDEKGNILELIISFKPVIILTACFNMVNFCILPT
jgi:hypothetical protein